MNDRNDYYPSQYPRQDRYDRLQALEAQFMQLQSMPMQYGVVVRVVDKPQDPKRPSLPQKLVTVSCAQGLLEFDRQSGFEAEYGDTVRLATTPQGLGIFDRTPSSGVPIGVSATVTTIFHDGIAEVDAAGMGARTVFYSLEHTPHLKVGAKVILDQYGKAILYADVVSAKSQFSFEENTNVSWDDIGGLYDAKRLLREAIELSRDYRGLYESYGKKPIRGILLAGPPGCGKTMLAKATATALHETYGASAYGGFFYVKGPALVEKYAGVGEAKVRELFAAAREFERKNGIPAVIFFDEIDAIASQRGDVVFTHIERKMVPTLIAEMDGMEHSSSLVIAATNKPKHLDAAIVRSGRMNYTVYVDRPNEVVTTDILALNLARVHCYTKPSDGVIGVSGLAKATSDYVFDDRHDVVAHQTSVGPIALKLKHLLNGALIADIVEKASSLAMHRDIDAKLTEATGVGLSDLKTAVEQTVKEESVKNHEDVVSELVGQMMTKKVAP